MGRPSRVQPTCLRTYELGKRIFYGGMEARTLLQAIIRGHDNKTPNSSAHAGSSGVTLNI